MASVPRNGFFGRKAGNPMNAYVYPVPAGEPEFDLYTVTVDGMRAPLSTARVSAIPFNRPWPGYQRPLDQTELAAFLSLDMTEPVRIEIHWPELVTEAIVRPVSRGVAAQIEGNTVRFTICQPGQYSAEVNGRHHNLHIFANAPEEAVDPAAFTYYFAPGVHEVGDLVLRSNESVYIAAGAVVHGGLQAYDAENIRICGRGILDYSRKERGDPLRWEKDGLMIFARCKNVLLEGITLRDASWWTVTAFNCVDLHYRNVKVIGMWRYNSDGFDFVNCQRVHVEGCFLRNYDDVIVFKGLRVKDLDDGYNQAAGALPYEHMDLTDYLVENCVLWCDWGGALEIGAETVADRYTNMVYRNCDILRVDHGALRIQSGDRAEISNVLYEDIRVEFSKYDPGHKLQYFDGEEFVPPENWVPCLIRGWMYCNRWSSDGILGHVHDITYRNIAVYTDDPGILPAISFKGGDEDHIFDRITIENVTLNGKPYLPELVTNEFVGAVRLENKDT